MRLIEYISSCIEQDDMTPALQDDMAPIKQEIIRCKDCKFYQENYMGRKVCFDSGMVRNSNDFCSQAKRKVDADEKKQAYEFTITCLTENVETLTKELERFMSDEVGAVNWTMCRELIEEEE